MLKSVLVAAVFMIACAGGALAHNEGDDQDVNVTSTRDMSFGRVTLESAGTLTLSANTSAVITYGGGARRVSGGGISSARFLVEGGHGLSDGDVISVTLPALFRMSINGRSAQVDQLSARLDDVGRDWIDIGAGQYRCTLSDGKRCAFVVGGRLSLTRVDQTARGAGSFSVVAEAQRRLGHEHGGEDEDHGGSSGHGH